MIFLGWSATTHSQILVRRCFTQPVPNGRAAAHRQAAGAAIRIRFDVREFDFRNPTNNEDKELARTFLLVLK